MQVVLYVIARSAQVFLGFVELAMMLRALLSWFVTDEENRFMIFLYVVTEPVILPIRVICSRFRALNESPLDISFFIAFIVISILNAVLPVLTL